MILDFLPKKFLDNLANYNFDDLFEIRLRVNYPIKIRLKSEFIFIENSICLQEDLTSILNCVTNKSIYAYNDCIKNGYLTTQQGVRIGIAGECVFENDKIITIKNINSLNVRIPHLINGCSNRLFPYVFNKKIYNSLIVSPPFLGKTTILKDLTLKLNNLNLNLLVIDERGEFSQISGKNIDFIKFSDKSYAFNFGLRAMSPEIIIVDELSNDNDWNFVKKAIGCGVKLIASCHANDIDDVVNKKGFEKGVFERFFILEKNIQMGVLKSVYDQNYNLL